jgi:hypothetical protein
MSVPIVNCISIFENKGKYYIIDGFKYDIHFPLAWALDHRNYEPFYDEKTNETRIFGTGPKECRNCNADGSINGVFVGYCTTCLQHLYNYKRGDHSIAPGMPINTLDESSLWKKYPYMDGIRISEIGYETEEQEIDDEVKPYIYDSDDDDSEFNCINELTMEEEEEEELVRLLEEEMNKGNYHEEDEEERYNEKNYENQLEKFRCIRD